MESVFAEKLYGEDWKSLMQIPKELDPYVNDYKMEVFEIAWLTDKQIEMFKSDFKVVAR